MLKFLQGEIVCCLSQGEEYVTSERFQEGA